MFRFRDLIRKIWLISILPLSLALTPLPSSPALSLFSHSKPVVSALTLTSLVINAPAVSTSPPLHMLPSTYPTLLLFLVLD